MFPDKIYFEPQVLQYELGRMLKEKYTDKEWVEIENHNNIPELRQNENTEFVHMKRLLIIGTRKTHKYVENHKVSDYLVPYTSSGCSAMCLYCYLVCHYNKCSYLRLFVNRDQMLDKIIKTAHASNKPLTFEIGSNSDLVLENTITDNLPWTIDTFAKSNKGYLTFPTKFDMVQPLLPLNHRGRVIFRMSVNPPEIIRKIEIGTSSLDKRIDALNQMADAGYKVGMLIAPMILLDNYQELYADLLDRLADQLSDTVKKTGFIEIILMTYSYIHQAINQEAFPGTQPIYDKEKMTGRSRGKYSYRDAYRLEAEEFIRLECQKKLETMPILYTS